MGADLGAAGETLWAEVEVWAVGAGHAQPVDLLLAVVAEEPGESHRALQR